MAAEYSEYQREASTTIENLRSRLDTAESELNLLDAYRRNKTAHDEELAALSKNVAEQVQYTQNALDEQERKFMEARAALVKELEDEKAAFRNIALNEARQTISVESKKVVAENIRLHDELKFHHAMTVELQAEKDRLIARCKTLQRDLDVLMDKDQEYARQSFVKSKEIKSLRDRCLAIYVSFMRATSQVPIIKLYIYMRRVEQLEKAHVVNTERFRLKAKELKVAVQKELEEATLDAAGLRRLMKIKNKELQVMKTLASTILSQRSDVEQFFLEALNEVFVRCVMKLYCFIHLFLNVYLLTYHLILYAGQGENSRGAAKCCDRRVSGPHLAAPQGRSERRHVQEGGKFWVR
jgi:hypothetical protein